VKSIPQRLPSPTGDSDSDFPPYVIAPHTQSAPVSLGVGFELPDAEGTSAVPGPSSARRGHGNNVSADANRIHEVDTIELHGGPFENLLCKII